MIVFFDQYPYIGGGQRVLLNIAEAVHDASMIFCIPRGGALESELTRRFPTAVIQDTQPPNITHGHKGAMDALQLLVYTIGGIFRNWRIARSASLLYANGGRQFPLVLALSLLTRRPAIYHLHLDHSGPEKKLIGLAARQRTTRHLIAISAFVRDRLLVALPLLSANSKLKVVENALSAQLSVLPFQDHFEGVPFKEVAVVGTVRPEKGHQVVIDLARQNPDLRFHVLGPIGSGAENWAAELKAVASKNVIFHGSVPDIPAAFDRLGVQVNLVPSQWQEPFGLVAIEGMACSRVTLVLQSGALLDIAAKTGAIACQNASIMQAEIARLKITTAQDLATLARRQHDMTQAVYGADRFSREMRALLSL